MNPGLLINIGARTAMMTRSLRSVSTEMAFVARNAGRMGDAMKKGTSAARLVGDSVHIATGVMKALGTATLATAGAFTAFATVTSKAFMGFESEMLRVEAVTGATQRQVDTLTGSIGKLSRATGITKQSSRRVPASSVWQALSPIRLTRLYPPSRSFLRLVRWTLRLRPTL